MRPNRSSDSGNVTAIRPSSEHLRRFTAAVFMGQAVAQAKVGLRGQALDSVASAESFLTEPAALADVLEVWDHVGAFTVEQMLAEIADFRHAQSARVTP